MTVRRVRILFLDVLKKNTDPDRTGPMSILIISDGFQRIFMGDDNRTIK